MLTRDNERDNQELSEIVPNFEARKESSILSFSQAFSRASNAHIAADLSSSRDDNRAREYDKLIEYIFEKVGVRLRNPIYPNLHLEVYSDIDGKTGERRLNPTLFEFDMEQLDGIPTEERRKVQHGVDEFHKEAYSLKDKNPALDLYIPGWEEIDELAALEGRKALEIAEQGVDGSWAGLGRTLGTTWGALHDQVNLKIMAVSGLFGFRAGPGAGEFIKSVVTTGVLNGGFSAGSEAIIQENVDPYYFEMGVEHDKSEAIVASGVGGVFMGGAQKMAGGAVTKAFRKSGLDALMEEVVLPPPPPLSINLSGENREGDGKTGEQRK